MVETPAESPGLFDLERLRLATNNHCLLRQARRRACQEQEFVIETVYQKITECQSVAIF